MCILFAHNPQIYFFNFFRFFDLVIFYLKTLIASGCLVNATPFAAFFNRFETLQMIKSGSENVHIVCT